jgi:hypothetical protein
MVYHFFCGHFTGMNTVRDANPIVGTSGQGEAWIFIHTVKDSRYEFKMTYMELRH